jgi:SNF2 family DNA or RNA helicase
MTNRGTPCAQVIRHFEFYTQRQGPRRYKFDVLITTFELSLKDAALLSEVKWSYLVVDEAHRLKNNESALYRVRAKTGCAPNLAARQTWLC